MAELARAADMKAAASKPARGHVRLQDVTIGFETAKSEHLAVEGLNLDIPAGQFLCVLGPSGCGKSSLLNAVAGYITPLGGRLTLDGEPTLRPGPERGMVFQQYSLFPWKTVIENVAFGPRMAGKTRDEARTIAARELARVGLTDRAEAYPAALSGGMMQRVGIARALAMAPSVLLMDEPFGALDAQTRSLMQETLLGIWEKSRNTVVFVTHDIDEAIFLADRVVIMSASPGRIVRDLTIDIGRPRQIDMLTDPQFLRIKQACQATIRAESRRVFEGTPALPDREDSRA